jgi:quinoprotein glucose dehydrogenase
MTTRDQNKAPCQSRLCNWRGYAAPAAAAIAILVPGVAAAAEGEWRTMGADNGFSRYSPLNEINRSNVHGLKILWTRPSLDKAFTEAHPDVQAGKYFRSTPIVVDGILFAPNGVGLVEAMDPSTGRTLWTQKPRTSNLRDVAGSPGRGVAYWAAGSDRRIFSVRGDRLFALDARTGAPVKGFGEGGEVALALEGLDRPWGMTGVPLVVGDTVVIGGGSSGDYGLSRKAPPHPVRAYDARTGRKLWEFSPMPQASDPARATWGQGSADVAGHMGSYGQLTADESLGLVYVPTSSANPPGYGGWRPGDNLYGTTLLALDLKTGRKVWHFQTIRHDVWDFDLAAPPVLGEITVNGKRIKAVMQTGKVPYLYTFDRATGQPVWPIIEAPAAGSNVPGEVMPATQPIPSKPEPLDRVGVTEADLIDFTPELKAQAQALIKRHRFGPVFTPPSVYDPSGNQGTLTLPGTDGGGNWNTGAFDPENGTYYAMTTTAVANYAVVKPDERNDVTYAIRDDASTWAYFMPDGLPLVKPPYGRITAVDMNKGEKIWTVANGDGPRDHPKLKSLNLPQLGLPGRVAVAVTKELILAGESSDAVYLADLQKGSGDKFRAYDKATGKILAEVKLPAGATGAPVTYKAGDKQIILIAVGDSKTEPQWVALGL